MQQVVQAFVRQDNDNEKLSAFGPELSKFWLRAGTPDPDVDLPEAAREFGTTCRDSKNRRHRHGRSILLAASKGRRCRGSTKVTKPHGSRRWFDFWSRHTRLGLGSVLKI